MMGREVSAMPAGYAAICHDNFIHQWAYGMIEYARSETNHTS